jgi:hypothetical protein
MSSSSFAARHQLWWFDPEFQKWLIVALRTAVARDGALDKEKTSFDDTLDAFRLALKYYE